ncbi:MAG TPA: bifunctional transaldolase/phosoglucose isomerase [Candidatus Baltobacteraceae bacterium]
MSNQLQQLLADGQSVWLDNLRRSMFASGELQRLIDQGLRGMTSNPTIFEKAIGAGDDYDAQLKSLLGTEKDPDALFWDLAVQDIQNACDLFRPVFDAAGGNDGFVSLEVSPLLAHDTAGTIAMAKELWKRVGRPNLMVKIPGTDEGVPAIEECIYEGININVTLIFAVDYYEKTARAYVNGINRRLAENKPVDHIRSVNSVFVSRIDSAVDKILSDRISKGESALEPLLGKIGIANLKLTYQKFKELFRGEAFAKAKAAGAAVQRPLWASTSTKNPAYPDLMYVETVIGTDTVNTMPPNTLAALLDHGTVVADTVETDLDGARATAKALQDAGISLYDVTHKLQVEGVASFSDSFAALLGAIVYKQKMLSGGDERVALSLGKTEGPFDAALEGLAKNDFLTRLWNKDATLWSNGAADAEIIAHALGWLDIPEHLTEAIPNLKAFAEDVKAFDHAVVLGMGGSSLAPDILNDTFGRVDGHPQLHVLDSTDPVQIAELDAAIDVANTLFIVASKSGTTTEPNAYYAYYHEKVVKAIGSANAGKHFVAITDPGTTLAAEAKQNGFRACFENDPNIGGRYSALSYFGMVPAAVAGYDVSLLLDRGLGAMTGNAKTADPKVARGVRFGAAIGGAATAGCDKLTIVTHPKVAAFGAWAEQLIAESTGKLGKGIVPIEGEPLGAPGVYGDDRIFVYVGSTVAGEADAAIDQKLSALEAAGHPIVRLKLNDAYDVGEQFYLWEIATAAAGSVIGIDAFDQPNVQESKDNTKSLLADYAAKGTIEEPAANVDGPAFDLTYLAGSASLSTNDANAALAGLLGQVTAGDYVALTAYIARNPKHEALLRELRVKIRDAKKVATTVGFGPRFLHSTGQLHKGGPNTIVALQITADAPDDPAIPGFNVGFRTLEAAQALGDFQALDKRSRRGARIHLKGDVERGLRALIDAVDDALAAKA